MMFKYATKYKDFIIVSLICLLAFGIRIGLILNDHNAPWDYGSGIAIGETARNLAEGRGYVIDKEYDAKLGSLTYNANKSIDLADVPPPDHETFTPYYGLAPGSSALLAATYIIFGEYRFIYLRVLQALIDSLGCLIMYLLGRGLFTRRIGLIASGIYAVFLPIAYLATNVVQDALMPFLMLTSFYFFIKGVKTDKFIFYIISAAFTGISCYFQPTTVFIPLLYGLGLLIYKIRKHNYRKQLLDATKITAAMFILLVAIISPWVIRNYHVTGALTLNLRVSTWGGIWEGMGEFDDNPVGAKFSDEFALATAQQELGHDVEFGSPEYDSVFKYKVINSFKEHPVWWLSAFARRFPLTIIYGFHVGLEQTCPEGLNVAECRQFRTNWVDYIAAAKGGRLFEFVMSHPQGAFYWGIVLAFAVIPVLLSIVGIWVMRKNWRTLILIATLPAYFSMVHMVVFVTGAGKSLLPGSIAYIILSAVAVDYAFSKMNRRHGKKSKAGSIEKG
jgi:4-amino-4-deoxy-L-arabinose transferase-like glycosyltransferase